MKFATYNVNGVNGRLPVLLRWHDETSPDVVCLQELKAPDERFPVDTIEAAGYEAIWHSQKSWKTVAFCSIVKGEQSVTRSSVIRSVSLFVVMAQAMRRAADWSVVRRLTRSEREFPS